MSQRPTQRPEQRPAPRRVKLRTALNRFDFDRSIIPDGMDYNWKLKTVLGEIQTEAMINQDHNGWTPVPMDRPGHREEFSGSRLQAGTEIERGGLVLMERPLALTEEARRMEEDDARGQVMDQIDRLGLAGNRAAGRGIKTTYDRVDDSQFVPD